LAQRHQSWLTQLPKQPEALWDWLAQNMQTQIDLLLLRRRRAGLGRAARIRQAVRG
jgi:hypothetical protein